MAKYHLITDKRNLPPLEGWRGVVALFVVSYHFSLFFFQQTLAPYGYLGVEFFFILSGFIICRQYEASIAMHDINFKTFLIRRGARLYPLYVVSIFFFLAVNNYIIDPKYQLKMVDYGFGPIRVIRLFLEATMLGSLSVVAQPNGPAWSVSVEWVVNLVFFALVWRYRRIPTVLFWVVTLVGAIYLLHVTPHVIQNPLPSINLTRGFVGFALGALIFRYHQRFPNLSLMRLYTLEILILMLGYVLAENHEDLLNFSVDYMFQLVVFPAIIAISLYRRGMICFFFSLPPITYLGRISYSIYLIHYPLAYLMGYYPPIRDIGYDWLGICYVVTLLVVSSLSYVLIEKPGRWLGRRLTRRPEPTLDPVPVAVVA